MALPATNYFEQMLGGDPFAVPAVQSPYPGLAMTPNFPVPDVSAGGPAPAVGPAQPLYEQMSPEEIAGISDRAGTRDMARTIAGDPYQEQEETGKTPWVAKVLGGLQDALAVISHAKNPESKAQFGGFAQAMFAKSEYNRGVRNRNAARAEKNLNDQAEIGRAIALRKISESITGGKDRSTETERFLDYLRASGESETNIQKYVRAQIPGTAEYQDVQDGKFKNFLKFRSDTERRAAAGDPEAIEALRFMRMSETELKESRIDEAKQKAKETAPYKKTGSTEDEGGPSLSAKQKNALQVELDAEEVGDKAISAMEKELSKMKTKEATDAPMNEALGLPSNAPAIKRMEKELNAKKAKAAAIRKRYSSMAGTAPAPAGKPAAATGWSITEVK